VSRPQTYLSADVAELFPNALTQEFWDRCEREELAFQRCSNCGTFRHPPSRLCFVCRSYDTEWVPVAGRGTVYSYTVVTHPVHPAVTEAVPYNIVLVEFPEAPGVRLVSNLIDVTPDELAVGLAVDVAWERARPDTTLPRFRRAPA
jgi:uncharacterized OB-fold protein